MEKKKIDMKKGKEAFADAIKGAADVAQKVAQDVQTGAKDMAAKVENDNYQRRLKKYNPIFLEEYKKKGDNIPQMIVIVDDAVRKGIDVCEGAIGWLSTQNGMEVLHLYDNAIDVSGLDFVPVHACDAVYYVDSHNRNRYINVDTIFDKAHEEKLAELKHIAHALGAKECIIEINEKSVSYEAKKGKVELGIKMPINNVKASSDEKYESNSVAKSSNSRSGKVVLNLEGNDNPIKPTLKWFQKDDNIKRLIEMRMNKAIISEHLVLKGTSSATMSQKTACSIDSALAKLGQKASKTMENEAKKEHSTEMIYKISF